MMRRLWKSNKKITALMMVFCMIVTGIGFVPAEVNAAGRKIVKKLTVSKSNLELEEGEREQIKYKVTVTKGSASWSSGNYISKFGGSQLEVYQELIANINAGKPVVIRVCGTRSRGHYVTVIGYTNVTNVNNLSAGNFLITDPGCGAYGAPENLGGVGYTLQNNGSGYQYCVSR